MDHPLLLLLGVVLLAATAVDALWTTLWVGGSAGPLSSRISTWMWRAALALLGRDRHRRLSIAGPVILLAAVLLWVTLMWAGWTLVFAGEGQSLLNTRDKSYADWSGRIYFVAYTMFTMGNGDFSPQGDAWQFVASLTNGSGMLLVTLAVTYLLSVISAVVRKRAFGSEVSGLGQTPTALLRAVWNGSDFRGFDLPLNGLASELTQLSMQYQAYPVLQYYHAERASKSPIIALVTLDDALTLLRFGVAEEARPNPAVLHAARSAVQTFLETLPSAFIHAAPEPPPAPSLAALRELGAPTVSDAEFGAALDRLAERRRKLLGLLRSDGWDWDDR